MKIENNRVVKANCKVLVIIAAKDANYNDKYEVVNTTMCDLGESKPFEYR
jgi:phage gp45-like